MKQLLKISTALALCLALTGAAYAAEKRKKI
jgi:hypothetical protein